MATGSKSSGSGSVKSIHGELGRITEIEINPNNYLAPRNPKYDKTVAKEVFMDINRQTRRQIRTN